VWSRKYKAGDHVRVRSRENILSTLDKDGCLDGMPFMPEMLRYCGQLIRVAARAHKTCDTVNNVGGVRVDDTVHLEGARCDGSSHDGCQAACLLFWRTAWIEPTTVSDDETPDAGSQPRTQPELPRSWSHKTPPETAPHDARYRCQATELPDFVRPMKWWDIRQYVEDMTSRNIGFRALLRGSWDSLAQAITSLGIGYRAWKRIYTAIQRMRGGVQFHWITGQLSKTPSDSLDLQPGEWVRIKSFDEIMATLDTNNKNRGLGFDPSEMGMFCERIAQVDQRLYRFIDDRTGRMVSVKEPTVILKGIYCSGERSNVRKFCPRAITPYWREIWLARLSQEELDAVSQ
jgi:hypothetical protein